MFRAAAEISLTGPLTVARIVTHAGVGRSTFYEFFDSPEHLLEQLELRALRALESALTTALTEARTPLERVRAVARRFLDALLREPHDARVVLASVLGQRTLTASLSPAGEVLRRALQQVVDAARAEGFWFKSTDELSVLAAAAAGEAIGRRQLRAPLREAPAALSELIVKLLR